MSEYRLFHIRRGDPIPEFVDGYLGLFNHDYAVSELRRCNEGKVNPKGKSWRHAYMAAGRSKEEIWVVIPAEAGVEENEWGKVGF